MDGLLFFLLVAVSYEEKIAVVSPVRCVLEVANYASACYPDTPGNGAQLGGPAAPTIGPPTRPGNRRPARVSRYKAGGAGPAEHAS